MFSMFLSCEDARFLRLYGSIHHGFIGRDHVSSSLSPLGEKWTVVASFLDLLQLLSKFYV